MTIPNRLILSTLLLIAMAFPFAAALSMPSDARAQTVDAGVSDGSGSGSAVTPAPSLLDDVKVQLAEMQAKYKALKDEKSSDARMLLWAALLAAGLKLLLDVVNYLAKSAKLSSAMAWVALGLAVPIALLSKFAAGTSWFDALMFAASGPGAVVVHELVSYFQSKKPPATTTAAA